MITQWRDQVKSWVNVYFLTLAWPCQRPQCLKPMKVATPSHGKAQRDGKPFLCVKWECRVCAENVSGIFLPAFCSDVYTLKTTLLQRFFLPRLAKSAYLYAITLPPCSLYKRNTELAGSFSFFIREHSPPHPSFSMFGCSYSSFRSWPLVSILGPQSCKDMTTQLDGFCALFALWTFFWGEYFSTIVFWASRLP